MKKLFITMITVLTCGATYALPVGNPSDASLLCDGLIWEGHCGDPCDPCLTWCDAFSMRIGFYGDYVFDRNLKIDQNHHSDRIEDTEMYTNAAYFAANFWDRLDIFLTLGASNIFIETNESAFGLDGTGRFELETNTDFSWGLGLRGTIWECGCTSLGAEAEYFYTKPHISRLTADGSTSIYLGDGFSAKYYEWQIGLGISHRINMLVPYLAVKWSSAKLRLDNANIPAFNDVTLYNLKSAKCWGYAVGVSLIDCEKASLTVEGRFGDEKAVHVNGQIRF